MGFIEGLRQKMQRETTEAQHKAQQEVEGILEAGHKRKIREERILQVRSENRPKWEDAKRQYDESGLSGILKKVIDLKGAESLYEDSVSFDETLNWEVDGGNPYFYAELVINKTRKRHDTYYTGGYSDEITTKCIGVETDKDGVISFRGKRHPLDRKRGMVVKVPKAKWQKDRGVLENALGKVYRHPIVSKNLEYFNMPGLFK